LEDVGEYLSWLSWSIEVSQRGCERALSERIVSQFGVSLTST
jgi:hypothetical protein